MLVSLHESEFKHTDISCLTDSDIGMEGDEFMLSAVRSSFESKKKYGKGEKRKERERSRVQ